MILYNYIIYNYTIILFIFNYHFKVLNVVHTACEPFCITWHQNFEILCKFMVIWHLFLRFKLHSLWRQMSWKRAGSDQCEGV